MKRTDKIGLIPLIIFSIAIAIILFSTYGCSEDPLQIEEDCNCEVQTQVIRVILVDGVPKVDMRKVIEDYPINKCELDGFKISDTKTIVCN